MKTIGRLLVAEFYHCDREVLNDEKRLEQYLRRATEAFGATIVGSVSRACASIAAAAPVRA